MCDLALIVMSSEFQFRVDERPHLLRSQLSLCHMWLLSILPVTPPAPFIAGAAYQDPSLVLLLTTIILITITIAIAAVIAYLSHRCLRRYERWSTMEELEDCNIRTRARLEPTFAPMSWSLAPLYIAKEALFVLCPGHTR